MSQYILPLKLIQYTPEVASGRIDSICLQEDDGPAQVPSNASEEKRNQNVKELFLKSKETFVYTFDGIR